MRGVRSILVLAAMLLAVSCARANATQSSGRTALPAPEVFLVGDSISDGAGQSIDATFERQGWHHYRVAIGGQSVADMQAYIISGAQLRKPDVMVIELGTNDMGGVELDDANTGTVDAEARQRGYDDALDQLDTALRNMHDVPCVVWLDVADWSDLDFGPAGHYNLQTWAPRYNAALRERQAHHPNLHVVSYAEQIRARGTAWMDDNFDEGWRIHPTTSSGRQAVADIMVDGIHDSCGI